MDNQSTRKHVLSEIRNPLVFFALALLIVEAIFGIVIIKATLPHLDIFIAVTIMAFLFLVVVVSVVVITIKWPSHLYEEISRDLQDTKAIKKFLDSDGFRDIIEDIIEDIIVERVKADSLINQESSPMEDS